MIDFHCHIDLFPDPVRIAEECEQRGIYVLSVTTTPSAWRGTNALAKADGRIRTALGLHPQIVHERHTEIELFDQLLPETRYVGEVGLDGGPEYREHWDLQLRAFEHVLASCRAAGGRIISLHSRRATSAVLDQLERYGGAGTPVLHWFSGSYRDLERAIEIGCWFSVGPTMLGSAKGAELVSRMPRERVLTESDGPFAQMDGKPVLPWQVAEAVARLSSVWEMSRQDASGLLHNNLRRLVTDNAASE